ncbi:hypothetical protein D3C85_1532990 [compost metagenome]
MIQVGVYRHLVIQSRLGVRLDAIRHARQGDREHQGAACGQSLEAVAIAARHLLPGERLAVMGDGVAIGIQYRA